MSSLSPFPVSCVCLLPVSSLPLHPYPTFATLTALCLLPPSLHTPPPAGLNTLKAAIQAFGLQSLHHWLRAIVASGSLALEPAPATELDPNPRNAPAAASTPELVATCVYCAMSPPCNVRILPCQHLSCHVCLLDTALKVSPWPTGRVCAEALCMVGCLLLATHAIG